MSNPDDRPRHDPEDADDRPVPSTPSAPRGGAGPDPLKLEMPTGEVGARNPPGATLATESGGTSKAEDTSRAAGYVADLTMPNEPPPGPPVATNPEHFAIQTGAGQEPGVRVEGVAVGDGTEYEPEGTSVPPWVLAVPVALFLLYLLFWH